MWKAQTCQIKSLSRGTLQLYTSVFSSDPTAGTLSIFVFLCHSASPRSLIHFNGTLLSFPLASLPDSASTREHESGRTRLYNASGKPPTWSSLFIFCPLFYNHILCGHTLVVEVSMAVFDSQSKWQRIMSDVYWKSCNIMSITSVKVCLRQEGRGMAETNPLCPV